MSICATFSETNSFALKIKGWKMIHFILEQKTLFSGVMLDFRECRACANDISRNQWKHVHNTAGSLTKKHFEL